MKADKQFPVEQFEATASQSTVPSRLLIIQHFEHNTQSNRKGDINITEHQNAQPWEIHPRFLFAMSAHTLEIGAPPDMKRDGTTKCMQKYIQRYMNMYVHIYIYIYIYTDTYTYTHTDTDTDTDACRCQLDSGCIPRTANRNHEQLT